MRRTVFNLPHLYRARWIISAHAENRLFSTHSTRMRKDHLRACGEQRAYIPGAPHNLGSSPRMRRTGVCLLTGEAEFRIISAHAENSIHYHTDAFGDADHLRACGEQPSNFSPRPETTGSSPRMRRTELGENPFERLDRIISAHAENRRRTSPVLGSLTDHLRACGEQA